MVVKSTLKEDEKEAYFGEDNINADFLIKTNSDRNSVVSDRFKKTYWRKYNFMLKVLKLLAIQDFYIRNKENVKSEGDSDRTAMLARCSL